MSSLSVDFEAIPSGIAETQRAGESADAFCARIAGEKCREVAGAFPESIIVAADTCVTKGEDAFGIVGKPQDRHDAARILAALSGKRAALRTAVCVMDACSAGNTAGTGLVYGEMELRALAPEDIADYLDAEPGALAAEGALVADGLAPLICARISEDEPGALSGLPMITLCRLLRATGIELP